MTKTMKLREMRTMKRLGLLAVSYGVWVIETSVRRLVVRRWKPVPAGARRVAAGV